MSALSHVYPDRACGGGRRARLTSCRQILAALAVSVVAGLAIFVTAVGSLLGGAAAAPPAVKGPPPGWIDLAFADLDAASTGVAVHAPQNPVAQRQNAQKPDAPKQDVVRKQDVRKQDTRKQDVRKPDPCADFVYYFLNKSCSVKRVGSVRRDGVGRRAVAARSTPAMISQDATRRSERVTVAATSTVATD